MSSLSRGLGRSRIVRLLGGLLVFAGSVLCALLLIEGGMRLFGINARRLPYHNNLGHPRLGMTPEPNRVWEADVPEYGGRLIMRTNNLGFYQDHDTASTPRPGVRRIAAVGDSFTVGVCAPGENFPHQLERMLNETAGSQLYEILDAGVGRYSPYQYFLRSKLEVAPLKPERILVAIYVGNDFLDIIRQDDRPYLTQEKNGVIRTHPPRFVNYDNPEEKPGWIESSRLYSYSRAVLGPTVLYQFSRAKLLYLNLATANRGMLEIAKYLQEVRKLDGISHGLMVQSLHQYVWFRRFPDTLPASLAYTRYTLEQFRTLGIPITCMLVPTKPMVEPETLGALFEKVTRQDPELTLDRLLAFENQLTDETLNMCREVGIEALDLRPAIRQARKGRTLYYPEDMHLNIVGNQVVARSIQNAWERATR